VNVDAGSNQSMFQNTSLFILLGDLLLRTCWFGDWRQYLDL